MTEDVREIEKKIDEKYEQVQDANLYEILEVEPDAESSEISSKFRNLAKEWHADRFQALDLDDEYIQKVREISTEINDAHRTLTDPDKRESYDASLEADPAEISSVIDAETAFRRGRNLLDAGRNEGAHRHFEKAVEKSPESEPEYDAHLKYAEYLLIPKDQNGRPRDTEKAREIYEKLDDLADEFSDPKDWMYAFLGVTALGLERTSQARRFFKKALRLNPDNRLANRQLRLLDMRRRNENEGFFSKLLSKLNLN